MKIGKKKLTSKSECTEKIHVNSNNKESLKHTTNQKSNMCRYFSSNLEINHQSIKIVGNPGPGDCQFVYKYTLQKTSR